MSVIPSFHCHDCGRELKLDSGGTYVDEPIIAFYLKCHKCDEMPRQTYKVPVNPEWSLAEKNIYMHKLATEYKNRLA